MHANTNYQNSQVKMTCNLRSSRHVHVDLITCASFPKSNEKSSKLFLGNPIKTDRVNGGNVDLK